MGLRAKTKGTLSLGRSSMTRSAWHLVLSVTVAGCGGSTASRQNATPEQPGPDAGAAVRDAEVETGRDAHSSISVGDCDGQPFDPAVEAGIAEALRGTTGAVDLGGITTLVADEAASLDGVQCLVGLEVLVATRGTISDLSPLRGLVSLESIVLSDNQITDLLPLNGHAALWGVYVERNRIATVEGLVLPGAHCNYTFALEGNPVAGSELSRFCDSGWVVTWGGYGDAAEEYCNLPCL